MKERVLRDLSALYEQYAQLLLNKEQIEIEIRMRQGMLNYLAQEEAEKAEEEKADDAE